MRPVEIVERLETLSPLNLAATGVLLQLLAGALDAEALVEIQPDLADYVDAISTQARKAQKVVERCLQISPCPTKLPLGF